MKTQSLLPIVLFGLLLVAVAFRPSSNTFDKITVHEFELTDAKGIKRASITVESNAEVVLKLLGEKGNIRVKLGATEGGSAFVLLNDDTNPGVFAGAKNDGTTLVLTGKDGKKREY
jgi:hypothetical protein